MEVDAVLGLSVTPSAVGVILVEGPDDDGNSADQAAFEIFGARRSTPLQRSEETAAAVLRTEELAADRGRRLACIGVTWSEESHSEAALLLKTLGNCGFDNVLPVSFLEASEALAWGVADVLGYDVTAVCVIESSTAIALFVHQSEGAVQTAVHHGIDSEEALIRWLHAVFCRVDWPPQALVVVSAGGAADELLPRLEGVLSVPVYAPAGSELALARGAALAWTHNADFGLDDHVEPADHRAPRRRRRIGHTGALAMLAAGAVTFVVSLSAAVSMRLAPTDSTPAESRSATGSVPEAAVAVSPIPPAPPPSATPTAGRWAAPVPEQTPPPAQDPLAVLVETPEPPQAPVFDGPAPAAFPEAAPPMAAPEAAPPPPGLAPAEPAPVPEERPGLLRRIKDRLAAIGDDAVPPPPPAPVMPPPPPEALPPAPPPPA
ncbi:hypothetical protein MELE44368_13670 [Mycolicibacterium elephantis DSM 44368]|uniref:DUF7159 domain-containing protein n=1 Tax=Mycolicibacterium elephantis DSM 44368 TaxID=1335622 RepID=A0A439DXF7_9MYCO|nr:hypothetical protein MELE44368_13670 [Mycolicibacterium elephantis DSM 44368]